jgi:hypothetical protein
VCVAVATQASTAAAGAATNRFSCNPRGSTFVHRCPTSRRRNSWTVTTAVATARPSSAQSDGHLPGSMHSWQTRCRFPPAPPCDVARHRQGPNPQPRVRACCSFVVRRVRDRSCRASDPLDCDVDLIDERHTKSGAMPLVPSSNVVEFVLCLRCENNGTHHSAS